MKTVEIFKTDVRDEKNVCEIIKFLLVQYNTVYKINFDLEDEENILRIEANKIEVETADIIKYIIELRYNCKRIEQLLANSYVIIFKEIFNRLKTDTP